jgi:phosphate-selective porin
MKKLLLIITILFSISVNAQTDSAKKAPSHWYDKVAVRGYMQTRYNRLLETNPKLKNDQGDKSIGENGGLFIRRMRIIFFGQIHERVYFYVQPDFASSVSSSALNFAQLRDAYMDIGFDKKNEFRVRIGQSKVPYGFENMQSSQNRLPLDRADPLNSAFANEREVSAFFYWAPSQVRELYSRLVREGLKGSGDYGALGFGVLNGQTANKPDQNNQVHIVARATYPIKIGKQIIEPGVQAYTGNFVIPADQLSTGVKVAKDRSYLDQRVAGTFVLYPQPFGIQAEYNIGTGPEFNKLTDSIESKTLKGGYITLSYLLKVRKHVIMPFTRGQIYDGGKKFELDARSYSVKELEVGVEWAPFKNFEFTAMYTMSERRFEDFKNKNNLQKGNLLRLQAQLNF